MASTFSRCSEAPSCPGPTSGLEQELPWPHTPSHKVSPPELGAQLRACLTLSHFPKSLD